MNTVLSSEVISVLFHIIGPQDNMEVITKQEGANSKIQFLELQ